MKLSLLALFFTVPLLFSCQEKEDDSAEIERLRKEIAALEEEEQAARERPLTEYREQVYTAPAPYTPPPAPVTPPAPAKPPVLKAPEPPVVQEAPKPIAPAPTLDPETARIQDVGMTFMSLESAHGKVYHDVRIREITKTAVRFSHRKGFISLDYNMVPRDWVRRYGMIPKPKPQRIARKVAKKAEPPKPVAAVEAEKASKPEAVPIDAKTEAADALVRKAVVIITGNNTAGTGFFMKARNKIYLYTAAHVLSGNNNLKIKSLSGREYKGFTKIEIAEGLDLARMAMKVRPEHVLTSASVGSLKQELEVIAFGNSGGAGVVNRAPGIVKGIGHNSFELTSEIIQGNSGGPIVSVDARTAVGVVTHAVAARKDIWAKDTDFAKVRRFGARLDRRIKWKQKRLGDFLNEENEIEKFDRVTRLLFALSMLHPTQNGLRMDTKVEGGTTALEIFTENRQMNAVRNLIKMNNKLASSAIKINLDQLREQYAKFYRKILYNSQLQKGTIESSGISSFNKPGLKESLIWRAKAERALSIRIGRM